jgi:hypothetical protein
VPVFALGAVLVEKENSGVAAAGGCFFEFLARRGEGRVDIVASVARAHPNEGKNVRQNR